MMALLFTLLAVCVLLAAFGLRRVAIACFIITFILACLWFMHHMSASIEIHL